MDFRMKVLEILIKCSLSYHTVDEVTRYKSLKFIKFVSLLVSQFVMIIQVNI